MQVELLPARDPVARDRAGTRAAEVLASGGLVVHPTETVYGIGGDGSAENNALIARVKRRPRMQPLILLTPDLEALRAMLGELDWPEGAERLAQRFWPGPLTLVLRCRAAPAGLAGPGGGIAVRISSDPTVSAVLSRWRRPMTSSSANLAGKTPARTVDDALRIFADREDLADSDRAALALDGGRTWGDRPSTIVSFIGSSPRLVREGPVSRADLAAWLPDLS